MGICHENSSVSRTLLQRFKASLIGGIQTHHGSVPLLIVVCLAILLTACENTGGGGRIKDGAPTHVPVDIAAIPDATPKVEKRYPSVNDRYTVLGKSYDVMQDERGYKRRGIASWYGTGFHGRATANGEKYDMYAMTAAHKTLPIPSYVRVTNVQNNHSVIVRVNDRGPFHGDRIIDLSYAAAAKLGVIRHGTADVTVEAIDPRSYYQAPATDEPILVSVPTSSVPATSAPDANVPADAVSDKPTSAVPRRDDLLETGTFLQVGAFQSLQAARNYRQKLSTKLAMPVVIRSDAVTGGLHRVRIGPIKTNIELTSVRDQLEKMTNVQAHLVYE